MLNTVDCARNLICTCYMNWTQCKKCYSNVWQNWKPYHSKMSVKQGPEFDRFFTYFERTWVGKRNTNPIYTISKWNMRERVLNCLLTTNNCGFHKKLSTLVGHRNPSVWTWLDAVKAGKANQNLSFNALSRHAGNLPGPLSNDTVIARQRQLKCVLRQFWTTSFFEYLELCNIGMSL